MKTRLAICSLVRELLKLSCFTCMCHESIAVSGFEMKFEINERNNKVHCDVKYIII